MGRITANSTSVADPLQSLKIRVLRITFPTHSLKLTGRKETSHRLSGWQSETPSSGLTPGERHRNGLFPAPLEIALWTRLP